jgi:hypothetical protein
LKGSPVGANYWLLSQVDWQIFGTLTFKQVRLPERIRIRMFFAMLRKLAKRLNTYFPRLVWALCPEGDGQLIHRHFHFLIAGLPKHATPKPTCSIISDQWQRHGGGIPRVAPYDRTLDGVKYILKDLEKVAQSCAAESAKSGRQNCEPTLSHSLWRMLKARHEGSGSSSTPKKVCQPIG